MRLALINKFFQHIHVLFYVQIFVPKWHIYVINAKGAKKRMKIDCVFSGGGVKAFAFVGALHSIEKHQLEIERTAGTSAGAIIASFLAAGYTILEIKKLVDELNLQQFLDPPTITKFLPFTKWLFLYFQLGIYKGDQLEQWLNAKLAAKNIYTFKDIQPNYLKVVVSDLSLGKLVVIPDDLRRIYQISPDDFPISTAVRMSAGFPYFFMPKQMVGKNNQKSLIVDGGLLSNFPLWIFDKDSSTPKRPILGIKLSGPTQEGIARTTNNALSMFHALFSTMKLAHDARYISKAKEKNIVFIPVKDIETVDFKIDTKVKQHLYDLGEKTTETFLKYWPN